MFDGTSSVNEESGATGETDALDIKRSISLAFNTIR